jgi:hypothetical protein
VIEGYDARRAESFSREGEVSIVRANVEDRLPAEFWQLKFLECVVERL